MTELQDTGTEMRLGGSADATRGVHPMLRLLLIVFTFSAAAPALSACYWGDPPPPRVPVQSEPGHYKTCPGGGTDC